MAKYKSAILPIITLMVTIFICISDHDKGVQVITLFLKTCKSTIPILLLMFLLLSFLKFGVDMTKLQKSINKQDGVRSVIFAYLFGTLVSGPIYPGFALSKMLIQGGARVRVIVIMLSVWATLKIPMLPYELKILGLKLCIIRWMVTSVVILLIGVICEKICAYSAKGTINNIEEEKRKMEE